MQRDGLGSTLELSRFNPRPARVPGDAAAGGRPHPQTDRFNPRPARVPGDAARGSRKCAKTFCFNPRPARVPGDAHRLWCGLHQRGGFNPRPARVPGDAELDPEPAAAPRVVSIRARHACRAMPAVSAAWRTKPRPFQSAPGTRAGRCQPAGQDRGMKEVSIRARHACRAMLDVLGFAALVDAVSIRARHACRAMPSARPRSQPHKELFQSAPGTRAGRCFAAVVKAGIKQRVSIRARHACRAMLRYRMQFI